jgi:hypothetical protein
MPLANETDFLALYRRLELSPGCGMVEFKKAYRRHVALLHPDRRATDHGDAPGDEALQDLISQYGAAMEFQRRHGRLPGAALPSRPATSDVHVIAGVHLSTEEARAAPRRSRSRLLTLLLAVVAVGVLLWSVVPIPSSPGTSPQSSSDDDGSDVVEPVARVDPVARVLTLGMPAETVRAIQGDPVTIQDDRWEYGPSWIRFKEGKVVDWHSSPLHSLKTADRRPPDSEH